MYKLTLSLFVMLFCFAVSANEIFVSSERVSSGAPKINDAISSLLAEADENVDGVQDFTLYNSSNVALCDVYLSPDYDSNWGEDILNGTISPGSSARVHVNGYGNHCMFDLQVVGCNGRSVQGRFDLCRTGTITIR